MPVVVTGLTGVTAIDAGGYHNCAVIAAGAIRCWGNGVEGELGDGAAMTSLSPVTPVGLNANVAGVAAGTTHTCAVLVGGSVRCWGENAAGRLGNGLTVSAAAPVTVNGW